MTVNNKDDIQIPKWLWGAVGAVFLSLMVGAISWATWTSVKLMEQTAAITKVETQLDSLNKNLTTQSQLISALQIESMRQISTTATLMEKVSSLNTELDTIKKDLDRLREWNQSLSERLRALENK